MSMAIVLNMLPSVISLLLIVSSIALYLLYYLRAKYTFWEKRGVTQLKPDLFFGNTKDRILQREPAGLVYRRIYRELSGCRFGGFYEMIKPHLLLRDPEVIRTVFVKNFSNFQDRVVPFFDGMRDPLSNNIFNLTGERWKNIRYKLTPIFSSYRLRQSENVIKYSIRDLDVYLTEATTEATKTRDVVNVPDLMHSVTIDAIGSWAYGLRFNTILDYESDFHRIKGLNSIPTQQYHIRNLIGTLNPRIVSFFGIKAHSSEMDAYFKSTLEQTVQYRKSTAEKRNDVLQHLIDVQETEKSQLTHNNQQNGHHKNDFHLNGTRAKEIGLDGKSTNKTSELLFTNTVFNANAYILFHAGRDATAFTLSYCLYELALNPEICEKVKNELDTVKRANNDKLDYNAMKKLVYLDAVISETLRKYPITPTLTRWCTASFKMPGSSVVIEKGIPIVVSIYGLHHDPKYYPEPEKFLPERFSEQNKGSILPGSYLPFGDGPRMCIGNRFAQFLMKMVLSHLVSKYTFHPCEETAIPLKFHHRSTMIISQLVPLGGIWIRFQRRLNP